MRLPVAMGALLIAASAAQAQDAGTGLLLPTVQVEGAQSAWGPIGGYVATNSAAGTKTDTPLIETPRSISVVSAEEISDRGAQSVVDAVSYSAGVVTGLYGYEPRFDVIYVRGFATTQLGDYKDGLRQANGSFAYFRSEVYGLERIDIIKGPASVLYGQTVPGGLVNRVSKLPTEKAFGEIEGQIGSPDWYQLAFDVGGPANKDGSILYRVTGVARKADGSVNGTANDELYLAPSVTFRNDKTSFTLIASVLNANVPASNFYLQTNAYTPPTRIGASTTFNDIEQTQEQIGYKLEHEFNDIWTVRQNLRYGHIDEHAYYTSAIGYITPTLIARYPFNLKATVDTFNVDNQAEAKFATGALNHRVLFGLDYLVMNNVQRTGFGSFTGSDATPLNLLAPNTPQQAIMPALTAQTATSVSQVGLYASDQIKFGEGWNFNIGGRQDFATQQASSQASSLSPTTGQSRDDTAFTWQTGLLYEFSNGVAPYASYATSFLPSTNTDLNGDLLPPSNGEQYEVGIKYQPKGMKALFTAAAYQLTQTNYAVAVPPFNLYYDNTGDVRVRGFEFEAAAELAPGFEMTAAYTYAKSEIIASLDTATIGNTPVNMPENVASLWAKYMFQDGPMKGFGVGAGVRYNGGFWADNANTYKNPSQTLVDAALYYEKDAWKVQLNAKNLFDEETAILNEGYWYWTNGRQVLLTASYRW
ncbi:TonB-dependent receptor [Azorhizobium oxalatiphilum]|uniref:TonB-dependent receptor n=1 Tax=Azorhizobium oxalatiphilum TaxID=980631 RepID=A0A917FDA0_9HYPH|nr:TonB-dependent receptor [Azorhizobium oxalatiphilum]